MSVGRKNPYLGTGGYFLRTYYIMETKRAGDMWQSHAQCIFAHAT